LICKVLLISTVQCSGMTGVNMSQSLILLHYYDMSIHKSPEPYRPLCAAAEPLASIPCTSHRE